jgi:hypothetical protein
MTLHTIKTSLLSENPDKWGRQLSENIELQIFLLNNHYLNLSDKHLNLEGEQDFAGIPRLQNISSIERKSQIEDIIIINTFLSMFRDVVVYIDKILSLYLWTKMSQLSPIPIEQIGDIDKFFEELPEQQYKKLTRSHTTFPGKLEMIPTLNQRSKQRLIGYNDIRVAFEHHGGIAKKAISFPISTIETKIENDGPQSVTFRLDIVEAIQFNEDEKIKLKPQTVSIIGYDIKGWIIKDILLAIDELDKKGKV